MTEDPEISVYDYDPTRPETYKSALVGSQECVGNHSKPVIMDTKLQKKYQTSKPYQPRMALPKFNHTSLKKTGFSTSVKKIDLGPAPASS